MLKLLAAMNAIDLSSIEPEELTALCHNPVFRALCQYCIEHHPEGEVTGLVDFFKRLYKPELARVDLQVNSLGHHHHIGRLHE